ncbi:MAG: hypothetical protein JKY80_00410 [Mariprofundaceae bacterium]|nr:hypothetical protein [Mariprofundaceae bacterium]
MLQWITWRVESFKNSVRYPKENSGVIPTKESLGKSVTTLEIGSEIKNDAFDLYTDAKKFLGEERSLKDMGY